MSADRPDIQYCVKELCRDMSNPDTASWEKLKRVGKFLVQQPRLVWKYCWEAEAVEADGYSDSNWAGCKSTRKSTSGGAIILGSHLIRAWAKTQATIALSSAEAELFGAVKCGCETLGIAALLNDLGQTVRLRMHMDASAALGIAQRRGVGKVRHLATGTLWLQEQELKKILELVKVPGATNVADIFTKCIGHVLMEKHLTAMNLEYRQGRASAAAELHSVAKVTRELKQMKAEIKEIVNMRKKISVEMSDEWMQGGPGMALIRKHRQHRDELFTPLNVALGPKHSVDVGSCRTTIGSFKHGGDFTKVEEWKTCDAPNRKLVSCWNGITVFSRRPLSESVIASLRLCH